MAFGKALGALGLWVGVSWGGIEVRTRGLWRLTTSSTSASVLAEANKRMTGSSDLRSHVEMRS